MSKHFTFLTVAVASLMVSSPVLANPNDVKVTYKDLNLSSTEGRAQLDRRLDSAASDICSAHGTNDLAHQDVARRCRSAVLGDARAKAQIVVAQAKSSQEVAAK
jgi:UrcA family protein